MRVLSVGNMYPPLSLGGYELAWRFSVAQLRANGHPVRVLTTDYGLDDDSGEERDPEVFRELRWYWREHEWPRLGLRRRLALERANARALRRHLHEFQPEVVAWWAMGGMSLSLIEQVRRRWPGLRVALATGWGAAIEVEQARAAGVEAVIAKPYRAAELLRVVAGQA